LAESKGYFKKKGTIFSSNIGMLLKETTAIWLGLTLEPLKLFGFESNTHVQVSHLSGVD
jgi:hypothetical protein